MDFDSVQSAHGNLFYLDDDAKLGTLARVPVGSHVVLQAVGKLACGGC